MKYTVAILLLTFLFNSCRYDNQTSGETAFENKIVKEEKRVYYSIEHNDTTFQSSKTISYHKNGKKRTELLFDKNGNTYGTRGYKYNQDEKLIEIRYTENAGYSTKEIRRYNNGEIENKVETKEVDWKLKNKWITNYKNGKELNLSEFDSKNNLVWKTDYDWENDWKKVRINSYNNKDSLLFYSITIFNQQDYKVEYYQYSDDELFSKELSEYDENNNIVKWVKYNKEGIIVELEKSKYNQNNKIEQVLTYSEGEELVDSFVYIYNKEGILIQSVNYGNQNTMISKIVYEYEYY